MDNRAGAGITVVIKGGSCAAISPYYLEGLAH
jgi:hypothetical protein